MNFIIISGQSGAGKSQAKKVFEDLGYYCIDNLPPSLIPNFVELVEQNSEGIHNIALVIDIRGGRFFKDLEDHLEGLKQRHYEYKIFYFEANDDILVKRFKETRRTHPLDPTGRIEDALASEKQILETLKDQAHYVINTSNLTHAELKAEITRYLDLSEGDQSLNLTIMSFGFKKGLPLDADFVFDVRFLPNPYYIEDLKHRTGNEAAVQSYVMGFEESRQLMTHIQSLLDFAMPGFMREGRSQLVIAIGCTGGQHRSVTFANLLAAYYREQHYPVKCVHRELD
ncbi:RNase adapter RapZ [Fusibacter paucivorans]|uniref:RNase adapter RapZ n=1 Tax=Fusibacter paucivorans TaxID=76009 RepID=A0ABS5PR24_9FIRM|nr:RNase adapter RapZ [Fusibacter paucivorans]